MITENIQCWINHWIYFVMSPKRWTKLLKRDKIAQEVRCYHAAF